MTRWTVGRVRWPLQEDGPVTEGYFEAHNFDYDDDPVSGVIPPGGQIWAFDSSKDVWIQDPGTATVFVESNPTGPNGLVGLSSWGGDITLTNITVRSTWTPSVAASTVGLSLRLIRAPSDLIWDDGPALNVSGTTVELDMSSREPLVLDGAYAWRLQPFWGNDNNPDPVLQVIGEDTLLSFDWSSPAV
jgi:hypothetical protein